MDVNPPFTDQEKRFVLAEAIKTSGVPVEKILPVFYDGSIRPEWNQMLLPHGRNMQSCINTFDALLSIQHPLPAPSFQPQSYQVPLPGPAPKQTKRKLPPESLETGGGAVPPKRRISDIAPHTSILPKPTIGSPSQQSPNSAQGKKRGRPSKAAVALRDAEAIARGEVIAPPPRTSSLRPDTPGSDRMHTTIYANIAPMVSPRPVPSPITPAAYETPSFPSSESVPPDKKKRPPPKRTPKLGESSFPIVHQPEPSSSSRSERTTYPSIVSSLTDTIPISYGGDPPTSHPPTSQPIQILHPPISTYGPPPPIPPPPRTEGP